MEITLPRHVNGQTYTVKDIHRQITVVGANGSGKSRFISQMIHDSGDRAFYVSAIDALYPVTHDFDVNSISRIYEELRTRTKYVKPSGETELDKLICMLIYDDLSESLTFRLRSAMVGNTPDKIPTTKVDTLIRLWKNIFTKHAIIRRPDCFEFLTPNNDDPISLLRLSHGEKAVLYYIGACLYAPKGSIIFVDSPTLFLHISISQSLWDTIEDLRRDCTFVYQTHDLAFPQSRTDNITVWIRTVDVQAKAWDYEILQPHAALSEQLILDIVGARKPAFFVEGDDTHSIDYKLYSLIFPDYTIRAMGSCDKVIETVRSFNDMNTFHHLDSWGIVDRDRRTAQEINYLRQKKILVPDVAEVENIMLLEGVVRAVARHCNKPDTAVFNQVRRIVFDMFKADARKQALMHTRHRVKHTLELIADRRFQNINQLEEHLSGLVNDIKPRQIYEKYCREFNKYIQDYDYNAILRVYNEKSMLTNTDVAQRCGLRSKDEYIKMVLTILRRGGKEAEEIKRTVKQIFGLDPNTDGPKQNEEFAN